MTPEQQSVAQTITEVKKTPALPKLGIWQIARLLLMAIAIVWGLISLALLWNSGIKPMDVLWALWWPAIFFVQFAVFTTPWRAVTVKEMGRMFLIGTSVVFLGALIGEWALTSVITAFPDINPVYIILRNDFLLGRGVGILPDIASPIVEELLKIAPVVVFLLVAGKGYWKRALGPLDVGLLGGACGAGYLFMENIARVGAGYFDKLGPARNVWEAGIGIDPFFIFPDMYHGSFSVWPGHPETAMFMGLCLGFGLMLRKKLPVIWAVIPVLGTLYMMWLHFLINYMGRSNQQWWAQILAGLNFNGGLMQYIMLLMLLMAVAVSMVTKYLYLQKDKGATVAVVGKETLEYIKANQKDPLLIVKKLWSLRHFWSFRHAVAYGVLYAKQQNEQECKKWLPWLYSLRNVAIGKVR